MASSCIYCRGEITPELESHEHVLWDSFGCSLRLPNDAVCRNCNTHFSQEVDPPIYRFFQPLLVGLEIRGSRGTEPQHPVVSIEANGGVESLLVTANFALERRVRLLDEQPLPDGGRALIFQVPDEKQGKRLLAKLRKRHPSATAIDIGKPPPLPEKAPFEMNIDASKLVRAGAKTLLNYAAYCLGSGPVLDRGFDPLRTAVLTGAATVSDWHLANNLSEEGFIDGCRQPAHRMALFTNGAALVGRLELFESFVLTGTLSRTFSGRAAFEHRIDAKRRTTTSRKDEPRR